ncbi:hypothetical protein GCM10011394_25530 [Luteimonas terricola]|uniref:Uncharacterized protein n=1 Tax=Luteimonas terricola TaxID=645597 RepID=A0ABQ2ELB8_9GAMM|nr:hypothetical protein GCM10011394_25530 [Luteimonas terricola]
MFGLLLIGIGIYAALFPTVEPVWGYIGGVLLTVLGGNAIYAALKDSVLGSS